MKFQLLSDVHLENRTYGIVDVQSGLDVFDEVVIPNAPILILAGDIGRLCDPNLSSFLSRCEEEFEEIIFVLGNHEFWGGTLTEGKKRVEDLKTKHDLVHILDNEMIEINGVKIFGSTLWSQGNEKCCSWWGDFGCIRDFSPSLLLSNHQDSCKWLKENMKSRGSGKTIVVSHHAPSFKCLSSLDDMSLFFASDQEELVQMTDFWAFGHTHLPIVFSIGKCTIASCPVDDDSFPVETKVFEV